MKYQIEQLAELLGRRIARAWLEQKKTSIVAAPRGNPEEDRRKRRAKRLK